MQKYSKAIYSIEDFSFSYPLTKKNIMIDGKININTGERVLIKGPSGSGKSTLLHALSGIIPNEIIGKTEGKILFKSNDITKIPSEELHKKIGIVFQNPYSQRVTSSVEDELVFYLENLGYSHEQINIRLKKLYKTFNLSSYTDKPSTKLSGGELQRIILASILIAEPDVLLFDEPTSYLDVKSEISFYRYLKEKLTNQTVIIVDHKINHNMTFINRIIEIDSRGKIIFDGPALKRKNQSKENNVFNTKGVWNLDPHNEFKHNKISEPEGKLKLKIENLSFSYTQEKSLLRGINLSIESGKVISIFGLNGSGKTTLIKIIAKLLKSKNSKISLNGKNKLKKKYFYRQIGVVFQNPETHFLFQSVGKEITNGKNITGINNISSSFNITDNILQNPFTLSEGQKRRLNLANIFYLNKKIVLLDEPTFGQDELSIFNLVEAIKNLKERGTGFLIVSHDTKFIRSVSDKVFYLKNGQLKELGKLKSYRHTDE